MTGKLFAVARLARIGVIEIGNDEVLASGEVRFRGFRGFVVPAVGGY